MIVLHVMWSFGFGGIERLVLDLCREQTKNGIDARVLVGQAHGEMEPLFIELGVPIYDAKLRSGFDPGLMQNKTIVSAMNSTDVIHIHSYSPAFARFAKISPNPVVFTDHGNYGLGRKLTWRDHIKFKLQTRFLHRNVNFMTFNSKYTRGLADRKFGLDNISNRVVYNGIDLNGGPVNSDSTEAKMQVGLDDMFVIGTSSRFAGFKRVDRLIQAFASMSDRKNCRLLLVGDGPYRLEYEQLVDKLGISEQTVFAGFRNNVRDYQLAMDVCVFPSCGEPFGLVAVETLNLGKPTVVMSDGGGIVEIIEPLEPEDVVKAELGLTQRLEQYHSSWKSNAISGPDIVTARKQHAEKYDIKRMASEFEQVYENCLHNRQKSKG